jgi:uncharacterized protein YkwD
MKAILALSILLIFHMPETKENIKLADSICLTPEEKKFYDLLMEYRKEKALKPIAISSKLTLVAQTHAKDLADNYQFNPSSECNPHSWSRKGKWSSCCYTSDHKQAKCMWDKPMEIAGYDNPGYEIAYYSSGGVNADAGLEGWKKSLSHNEVMVNEGIWTKAEWNAVGVGFYKQYAVVWFGQLADVTSVSVCTVN